MDEFLSVSSTQLVHEDLQTTLTAKYKIKRLGFPAQYLKWHRQRPPHGSIHILHPQVATAILTKTGILSANPKPTPLPPKAAFTFAPDNKPLEQHQAFLYRQTIGDLCYLADSRRPYVHISVSMLSLVIHKPAKEHKNQLQWLLRYLSGTNGHGILFNAGPRSASTSLCTYSDSDFANDHDPKSRSAVVHMLHGGLISWTSARETVVADSTCAAEYLAATAATQQVHWLRRPLGETCTPETQPTPLFVDTKAAIFVAQNLAPTKRRKCIDVKHHLIHNHIQRGTVNIQQIPSNEDLPEYFTKPLGPQRTQYLLKNLSIVAPKPLLANPGTV